VVPYDQLLTETDPALVTFQIDLYWMIRAGRDPVEYLERYPGRFTMLHAKDSAGRPEHAMVDVGKGTIDFKSILAKAMGGGVKHVFVEHDNPADPIATITNGYQYLSKLEF
jgi:sugar phosphate isomerase/epimerase